MRSHVITRLFGLGQTLTLPLTGLAVSQTVLHLPLLSSLQVAIGCRPSLYIINLLVPSSFLVAIDALSFYLPAESKNWAPFKTTLPLGYNVFLLTVNDLLPATGTPLISIVFPSVLRIKARLGVGWGEGPVEPGQSEQCPGKEPSGNNRNKSHVVPLALTQAHLSSRCLLRPVPVADGVSLPETIFITYLLHLATAQPPPLPWWLHSLLLHCTSPGKCCPLGPQKGSKGLGLTPPTHLVRKSAPPTLPLPTPPPSCPLLSPGDLPSPWLSLCLSIGVEQPVELVGKVPGPREAELSGCPGSGRAQQEDKAQKQHLVGLWVQFSHMMDTLLFRLYLLFLATSIITVIILWNTKADLHSHHSLQTTAWSFPWC